MSASVLSQGQQSSALPNFNQLRGREGFIHVYNAAPFTLWENVMGATLNPSANILEENLSFLLKALFL